MRAGQVLQDLLAPCLALLETRLVQRLLGALDAWVASRQVVLMELARQYQGAMRVAAPLKPLDRLLSKRIRHSGRAGDSRRDPESTSSRRSTLMARKWIPDRRCARSGMTASRAGMRQSEGPGPGSEPG